MSGHFEFWPAPPGTFLTPIWEETGNWVPDHDVPSSRLFQDKGNWELITRANNNFAVLINMKLFICSGLQFDLPNGELVISFTLDEIGLFTDGLQ